MKPQNCFPEGTTAGNEEGLLTVADDPLTRWFPVWQWQCCSALNYVVKSARRGSLIYVTNTKRKSSSWCASRKQSK